ncbi:ATP-binding protein [Streptomyces sp. NPDC001315]|uniref:ATP-binding protein n=1 Tax=Streptomyces sp. NPDC001315 TaxID=3364562 RepID=UPI0036AD5FA1
MPLSRQCCFPRSRASVRGARGFVLQTLTDWSCTDRLDDIRLCVSELATNAMLHGAPPGREYCVSLSLDGAALRLEVRDSGDQVLGTQHLATGDPNCDAHSGRGLLLVRESADDIGVTAHTVGKTVWTAFKVAGQAKRIAEGEH